MLGPIDRKLWLPYIKTYEDFNKKIPDELKELFSKIREKIGEPTESFTKQIDLEEFNFCENIINIMVTFNKLSTGVNSYEEKDIIYYSNININDLLSNQHFIDIPIRIDDININIDKLISVISHEIRHIYDVFTINEKSDMNSFIKSFHYGNLKKIENNKDFKYFLYLVYLSLEHELVARNTMIWEMFINCNCCKEELNNLFKKLSIYNSFEKLNNFDYHNLLEIPDIINKVNNFIFYFKGDVCVNDDDVELFFQNWKKYFIRKSNEYEIESTYILNDLWMKINEKKYTTKDKEIKNVKDMLLDIHNKYIFKK